MGGLDPSRSPLMSAPAPVHAGLSSSHASVDHGVELRSRDQELGHEHEHEHEHGHGLRGDSAQVHDAAQTQSFNKQQAATYPGPPPRRTPHFVPPPVPKRSAMRSASANRGILNSSRYINSSSMQNPHLTDPTATTPNEESLISTQATSKIKNLHHFSTDPAVALHLNTNANSGSFEGPNCNSGGPGVQYAMNGARREVVSSDLLFRVLEGCKRKYKAAQVQAAGGHAGLPGRRRRVSYSHPLFRELLEAFSALTERGGGRCARVEVWRLVALRAEAALSPDSGYFDSLDVSDEAVDEAARVQIEKDIARSGSLWDSLPEDEAKEWRNKLRHILRAYAVHDRRNGYTQGMNLFAAEFLFVTGSEELAFWLVMHVCHTGRIAPDYFTADISGLKRDVWVLQQLLEQYFPELMAHLKKCELDVSYMFIGPLLSLFCSVLPPGSPRLHQFYDVMLANGETTLFAALLCFFKMNEPSLMQLSDAGSLMDSLNQSLETMQSDNSAFMETFHRSLLQWCMVLDPGTIADFRKCAPMHWCNMDLVMKMARERDQELLAAHANAAQMPTNSNSSTATSSATRYRLKIFAGLDRSSDRSSSDRSAGPSAHHHHHTHSEPLLSPTSDYSSSAASAAATSPQAGGTAEGLMGSTRALNLRVVWVVSNLRNAFASAASEEYRQAAIATCKEILEANGYAELLLHQQSDLGRGPGTPMSASPLLPGSSKKSLSLKSGASKATSKDHQHGHTTSSAAADSTSNGNKVVATAERGATSTTAPLSSLTSSFSSRQGGSSREKTKLAHLSSSSSSSATSITEVEHFGGICHSTDVWRAPDSYLAMRALLEGLMDAVQDTSRDVSDTSPLKLLLDRLYLCLRTSRDVIPLYKNSSTLLTDLSKLLGRRGAERSSKVLPWRKKLRNVFRPRRSTSGHLQPNSSTSTATSAGATSTSSSSPMVALPPNANHSNNSGHTIGWTSNSAGSSGVSATLAATAAAISGGISGNALPSEDDFDDRDRHEWRTHLVLLLLALKLNAENREIRLYDALDEETGTRLSGLFEEIATTLRGDIETAILSTSPVSSSSTTASQGATTRTNRLARPLSPSDESMPVHASDTEEEEETDPVTEFNHSIDYQLRLWSVDAGEALYMATWTNAREADLRSTEAALSAHRRFKSHAMVDSSATARIKTRSTAEGFSHAGLVSKKSRSRSTPTGHHIPDRASIPKLSREVPISRASLQRLDVHKVREISLANSQHWRALYWALRSNYHLILEMSQLADVATTLSCRSMIKELASVLHTCTYDMQAKLGDAARVDHIALQIETFHDLVSQQSADAESHANQVLLDDLSDQVKLCQKQEWREYLGDQLETIQGQLIL